MPTLSGLYRRIHHRIAGWLDLDLRLATEDRRILEQVIFPEVAARTGVERVLFVGCDWYTRHYHKFFRGKEYWTLEREPTRRRYGGKKHVVAPLEQLPQHFPAGHFDVIFVNGVFGWGLDQKEDAERAIKACFTRLRPGGLLVIGWNDIPERTPFRPSELKNLGAFQPFIFGPFLAASHLSATENRHIFEFFQRPAETLARAQVR